MIQNRSLPSWIHRVANGVLGFLSAASVGDAGYMYFRDGSLLEESSAALLVLSPLAGAAFAAINPEKFSLSRWLAG